MRIVTSKSLVYWIEKFHGLSIASNIMDEATFD